LVDVTLASDDSSNLPFLYQLLSVLTAMLKTLDQNKSHVVDARSRTKQKPWYQKNQTISTKAMLLKLEQKKIRPS